MSFGTHSILITGLRGVGKSTLALMAATALNYSLVDLERCVYSHTGSQESAYINNNSITQFRALQHSIIQEKVAAHSHRSIIILPSTFIDHPPSVIYISSLLNDHPIIHIHCEFERLYSYFNVENNNLPKLNSLLSTKRALFSQVTNFEFSNFNCLNIRQENKLLQLKLIEKFFIKFIYFIIGGVTKASIFINNSHLPLIEDKQSCIVQMNYPHPSLLNYENINDQFNNLIGSDSIELKVNLNNFIKQKSSLESIVNVLNDLKIFTHYYIPLIISIDISQDKISEIDKIDNDISMDEKNHYEIELSFEILLLGIRLGIDYITIDLSLFSQYHEKILSVINKKSNTKIIGAYHNENLYEQNDEVFWNTSKPTEICNLARTNNINILRISSEPKAITENYDLISSRQRLKTSFPNLKLSLYNSGKLGFFSKIINECMTPVSPNKNSIYDSLQASLHQPRQQPTNISIKTYLNSQTNFFTSTKQQFYVMGSNISTSLSPTIHNTAYHKIGLPHTFQIFESSNINDLTTLFQSPNFGGTGVIMPFKVEAMSFVDNLSVHCVRIGALNTIIAQKSETDPYKIVSINGENTDWLGIKLSLLENISPINAVTKHKTALVLGAGGMSRATIYALVSIGFTKIFLFNRTYTKAVELANYFNQQSPIEFNDDLRDFKIHVIKTLDENIPQGFMPPIVIVSCIPGRDSTTHQLTHTNIPDHWFSSTSGGVMLETGYDPLVSSVLEQGARKVDKGWIVVNGLNYLYNQAVSQFEMFVGRPAPRGLMRDVTMRYFNDYDY